MLTRLCVNVDHIATLRQARGTSYPDPVAAAEMAEAAGAAGITIHLRSDRRHIQDADLVRLRQSVSGKLNLEMATTDEMLRSALENFPDQVTLVPERPEEITTEGGLDLTTQSARIQTVSAALADAGIAVSVFVDPEMCQIELLASDPGSVGGFEINTDTYTRTTGGAQAAELEKIVRVATLGAAAGLEVYAGHGLHSGNVRPIAAIAPVEELNIGHSLVSRAALVGMDRAVREMIAAIE